MALEKPSTMQRFPFVSFDEKPAAQAVKKETPAPAKPVVITPEQLPLPAPVFTDKDIQAARAEGHGRGQREGFAAATSKFDKEAADRDDAIKALLEVIANRITIAAESQANALKQQQDILARVVLSIARKLVGDALRGDPYSVVQSLLQECMALVVGEPKVMICASAALVTGLRQRIDLLRPMLQGFEGEIVIAEDESLFDQDCRVEWKNGYAEHNATDLWHTIETILNSASMNAKEG